MSANYSEITAPAQLEPNMCIRITFANGRSMYATISAINERSATLTYVETPDFQSEWRLEDLGLVPEQNGWQNPNRVHHLSLEEAHRNLAWAKTVEKTRQFMYRDLQAAVNGQPSSGVNWGIAVFLGI